MKLKKLLKLLQQLPEEALEAEVLYVPDETNREIVGVDYSEKFNVVYLMDEYETK